MKRLTTFLMTLLLSLVVSNAFAAESDITADKLTNPSFEADDVSGLTLDGTRDDDGNDANGTTGAWTLTADFLSEMGWTVTNVPVVMDLMTEDAGATDNNFGAPGTQVTALTCCICATLGRITRRFPCCRALLCLPVRTS